MNTSRNSRTSAERISPTQRPPRAGAPDRRGGAGGRRAPVPAAPGSVGVAEPGTGTGAVGCSAGTGRRMPGSVTGSAVGSAGPALPCAGAPPRRPRPASSLMSRVLFAVVRCGRGSPGRASHGHVRNPVPVVAGPVRDETETTVQPGEVRLGVEHARRVADLLAAPPPAAAGSARARGPRLRCTRARSAVPRPARPGAAGRPRGASAGPIHEVDGAGFEVAAVQLGVGAALLDDEHVDPQPQQPVERCAVRSAPSRPVHLPSMSHNPRASCVNAAAVHGGDPR